MDTTNNNIGKKTSFIDLVKNDQIKIEIPIIQRDYAQGRDSEEDIRNQFIETIFSHLKDRTNLHLDFIYGDVKEDTGNQKKLIPLDGQQRLTTLFLLHWYFAKKDGFFSEFKEIMTRDDKVQFYYETRISSREFCKALLTETLDYSKNLSISDTIKNKNWYFYSWEKDPTIKSMLAMLETIQALDEERDDDEQLYPILKEIEDPILSFQFIELANFGLTDSLYIKMNARGKALTVFENFKAKIEQVLLERKGKTKDKLYQTFSTHIDKEWTDFFWKYRDAKSNLFDNQFMNITTAILCNSIASEEEAVVLDIRYLQDNKSPINYYILRNKKCFEKDGLRNLIEVLDLLQEKGGQKKYLSNKLIIDEEELIKKGVRNSFNYAERLQFYALYEYVRYNGNSDGIEEWMRVVRNLTESTNYDEAAEFYPSVLALKGMLEHSFEIVNYFHKNPDVKTFAKVQIAEEVLKAKLILKGLEWEEAIKVIENHPYFKGQISFLLDFSGIQESYEENSDLNWSAEENNQFLQSFLSYSQKAKYIFESNGIKQIPDFLFERALLSLGDYTLTKRSNFSFLINGFDREISWKRLLRNPIEQRVYVKELMDKIDVKIDLNEQLLSIISMAKVDDWRKFMVNFQGVIEACGSRKLFRFNNENDILLLRKTQTNGAHSEYYTYSLYLQLLEMGIDCTYYEANSVEEEKYVSIKNVKECLIYYGLMDDEIYGYWLVLDNDEVHSTKVQDDVINYLREIKFIVDA